MRRYIGLSRWHNMQQVRPVTDDCIVTPPVPEAPEVLGVPSTPPDLVDERRPPPPPPGAPPTSSSSSSLESPWKPKASSPNSLLRSCRISSWYCGWSSVAGRNLSSAAPSGIHSKEPGCFDEGNVSTGTFQSCTTRSSPARTPRGRIAALCRDRSRATPSQVKSLTFGGRC